MELLTYFTSHTYLLTYLLNYLLTLLYLFYLLKLLTYLLFTSYLLSELIKQSVSYVRAKYLSAGQKPKFTVGVMCLSALDVVILVKCRQYCCGACSVFMLSADCI